MPGKQSAGVLLYRRAPSGIEVLLVHPGGPFWKNKDAAAWSIPKGELAAGEDALAAARREFLEETGQTISERVEALEPVKQPGGKIVYAFAIEGDCDVAAVRSNSFTLEWPPRSGKLQQFPEIDRAEWFTLAAAAQKLHRGLVPLLDQLVRVIERGGSGVPL